MATARDDSENEDNNKAEDDNDDEIEEIKDETEKLFRNFVYRRLTSHIDKEATEGDLELASIQPSVLNNLRGAQQELEDDNENEQKAKINKLGKALALYGDEIQHKYHDTFQDMMMELDLNQEEHALPSFTKIARKLFENGINWGRIVALLCFGYEIAITVIRRGVYGIGSFLRKIIGLIVNFIVNEKIASWIAAQGGWASLLRSFPVNQENGTMRAMLALIATIGGAYLVYKFMNSGK